METRGASGHYKISSIKPNNKKIAILFSGKGSNLAYLVKTLHSRGVEVVVALTNNPKAEGIAIAKTNYIPP